MDPSAEDGDQESLTPYQYGLNNPVTNDDPDGRCPVCAMFIGAAVGAGFEYATEVVTNVVKDGHISTSAFTNVSGGKILLAAGAGALGGGIGSGAARLGSVASELVASSLGKAAVKESVAIAGDVVASAAGSKIQGKQVSVSSVAADVTGGVIGRGIANKVGALAKDSPEGRQLARSAKRAENVAVESRPTRQAAASAARKAADEFGSGKAAVSGAVGTNATSTGVNVIRDANKDKNKPNN